jgi:radical SAM protein with 4Fe4S-binding SPASM domain
MCAMWQKPAKIREEMTLEEWKHIIDALYDMGVSHIEFFGGDALLRKDILANLISYAHNKNFYTELPTNSNLLNKELSVELVNSGLDAFWISLNAIGETHNEMKGRSDAFSRVNSAIEELKSAKRGNRKPWIFINCVITKHNVETFDKIIPYALDMGIDGIDYEYVGEMTPESIAKTEFNGLNPEPFFITTGSSALLDKKEATLLKKKISDIKTAPRMNGLRINTEKIDILSKEEIVSGKFQNKRCYISRNWVTIDPYGNVMGCLHYNNCLLGNAKENDLSSIWKSGVHFDFIRSRDQAKFDICNFCSNGVIRNSNPLQSLQTIYYKVLRKGKD